MAVSRSGKSRSPSAQFGIPGSPPRTSFAKIREPLEVPNLLALQTDSFDWLVGNEAWRARVADGRRHRRHRPSGLEEILSELSPIEDFSGSMSLSFSNPRFEDVKALHRGVQGQGHDLRGAAVRHRGVHQQHHRRDQVARRCSWATSR